MNLSKKAIEEFKAIIKKDYGKDITDEEAQELGVTLLRLTRVGLAATARAIDKENAKKEETKTNLQRRRNNSDSRARGGLKENS
jgi:hypothetical protein